MPATPSQIRRPIVIDHEVDFGEGVVVCVSFDRNKITDAWMRQWMKYEEDQDIGAMNEVLNDLIISWDVQNDDGTPYPKNAETIGFLFALPDKGFLFQEILKASVPSRAEGNASSEHSSTPPSQTPLAEPQPTFPNGPAPSPSPSGYESPSPT